MQGQGRRGVNGKESSGKAELVFLLLWGKWQVSIFFPREDIKIMAVYKEVRPKQTFIGKLNYDSDLLEELTAVCKEKGVSLGVVEAIGAVKKARLGYYDQGRREYQFFEIDKGLEITSLLGNISLRDGEPMVHAHVTLADSDGRCYGGHLASGTVVFAGEFLIRACEGPTYSRGHDEKTGLPLWEM